MLRLTKGKKANYFILSIAVFLTACIPLNVFSFQGGPPPPNGGLVEDVPPEVCIDGFFWVLIVIFLSCLLVSKRNTSCVKKT